MKVFVAGIYDKFEGGVFAMGIFTTREKAEQAGAWLTKYKEYFAEYEQKAFHINEMELDDIGDFEHRRKMVATDLEYVVSDDNNWTCSEEKAAARIVLDDLRKQE